MQINFLSPTTIEQARLCEARLMGRLNQLGEQRWDEDHGEGALMGTLAHEAAQVWYRPNEKWTKRVIEGMEPWEPLAQKAQAALAAVDQEFPPPPGEIDEAKAARMAAWRKKRNQLEEAIATEGLLKHPYTDPDYVFRLAIVSCAKGEHGFELPKEINSVGEARTLFDGIIQHYDRNKLNIVFAERRYKGTIGNGVPIHLIIDLGVDRGDGRLELIDYKTGWVTVTTEEMYAKDQVLMNLLAVARYDPTLARFSSKSFTYFWVRSSYETGPVSHPEARLVDYECYLAATYQHLIDLKEPSESYNRFCEGCPRRLRCVTYREFVAEAMGKFEDLTPEALEALGDEDIMATYDRTRAQFKMLEDRKKALAKFLEDRMNKAGVKLLETDTFKAAIRQNRCDDFDTATVLSLCAIHRIDASTVVSCTKKSVEAALGGNPEAMRMLGMTMRRGCASPWVDVRQIKKTVLKPKKSKAKKGDAAPDADPTATASISSTSPL